MKKLLYFLAFISLLLSCSNSSDLDPEIGKKGDDIKLSSELAEFDFKADSLQITAKGTKWCINSVQIDDDNNINETNSLFHYSLIKKDFSVVRRDPHTIFIRVSENKSDVDRHLTIGLQSGNFFNSIKVIQKHK